MNVVRTRRRPRRSSTLGLTACLAAAALALAGCTSDGDDKSAAKDGPSVIAPGKPGEEAETLSPKDAAKQGDDDSPNSADFDYVRMMIEHHTQALTMTKLAPKQAGGKQVKRLAKRIAAAQRPEIGAMEGWQKRNGGDKRAGGGHGDHAMPGMATDAQLKDLRAAKGKAFDKLFLKLMITHHQGAVTMATDVLAQGNNVQVEDMATDVIAQQTAEINRMRGMP
ncbi:DUF305 domain-containing protein [Streptomyces boninensis]|uniref:DUF305 domain-containing protein n=1 Tax=Streptomyces boninensis TaxID=2039455 RepID=UPI003B224DC4